jgi:hypothetical protein
MHITEEIYQQVQSLPEDMAREVLEFINYLKKRRGLPHEPSQEVKKARHVFLHTIQENPEDEVWNDLLFGQSRYDAVSLRHSNPEDIEADKNVAAKAAL